MNGCGTKRTGGGSNILPTGTFTKGNTCATAEKGTACTSGTMETNTKETGHEESRVALGATPFKTKICFMVRWKDGICGMCRACVCTNCFFLLLGCLVARLLGRSVACLFVWLFLFLCIWLVLLCSFVC